MDPLRLLNQSDPNPVRKYRENSARNDFVLVGDHAGREVPAALHALGLAKRDLERHIAVDIGVLDLGNALADLLDAPFISQRYSRLVVDCNRWPSAGDWIAEASDGTVIPGNRDLDGEARNARKREIYDPYHQAIADALDERTTKAGSPIFVSLHSFAPELAGQRRPWEIGVLHDGHCDEFALALLELLRASPVREGDNQPYRMDATDFTVPYHAFARGLSYVEIEVRQDLFPDRVQEFAEVVAEALTEATRSQLR